MLTFDFNTKNRNQTNGEYVRPVTKLMLMVPGLPPLCAFVHFNISANRSRYGSLFWPLSQKCICKETLECYWIEEQWQIKDCGQGRQRNGSLELISLLNFLQTSTIGAIPLISALKLVAQSSILEQNYELTSKFPENRDETPIQRRALNDWSNSEAAPGFYEIFTTRLPFIIDHWWRDGTPLHFYPNVTLGSGQFNSITRKVRWSKCSRVDIWFQHCYIGQPIKPSIGIQIIVYL